MVKHFNQRSVFPERIRERKKETKITSEGEGRMKECRM